MSWNNDIAVAVDDVEDGRSSGLIPVDIFGVGYPRSIPTVR